MIIIYAYRIFACMRVTQTNSLSFYVQQTKIGEERHAIEETKE